MTSDTNTDPTTVGPEYQGWANRETWAASLHLSNTRWMYDNARQILSDTEYVGPWSLANALEEWTREMVEENREQQDDYAGAAQEITSMDREVGSWWRVNWREVADGLMDA
jgi:hypothetical protein